MAMAATKETWLDEGLSVLAESGIDSLTIDALCTRLRLTKGSFNHHFKGREAFTNELLTHWEQQYVSRPIQLADEALRPTERFDVVVELAAELPQGPDVAIRGWALRDPVARSHVERVDRRRLEYLHALVEQITGDADRALLVAQILLTIYVGSTQTVPNIEGERFREMISQLRDRLF